MVLPLRAGPSDGNSTLISRTAMMTSFSGGGHRSAYTEIHRHTLYCMFPPLQGSRTSLPDNPGPGLPSTDLEQTKTNLVVEQDVPCWIDPVTHTERPCGQIHRLEIDASAHPSSGWSTFFFFSPPFRPDEKPMASGAMERNKIWPPTTPATSLTQICGQLFSTVQDRLSFGDRAAEARGFRSIATGSADWPWKRSRKGRTADPSARRHTHNLTTLLAH